jgi:predicted ATP-dependent serine protease
MLATEPEPVPWTAEPILAEGCVTMLAGREGQGKSMLALAIGAAIGHGATVAGIECQLGKIPYIDAENGEREAHRRIHGLGVKSGTLEYVEAVGFDLATDIGLIAELVDEHRPTVLVLDSARTRRWRTSRPLTSTSCATNCSPASSRTGRRRRR